MLFTFTLTTVMVATNGFGAFPENALTESFQEVLGENFPPEVLDPFNSYMEGLSAPQIPPVPDSDSESAPPPDPVGFLVSLLSVNAPAATAAPFFMDATTTALAETQTQVAVIQNRTVTTTPLLTETITPIPSPLFTDSPIPTTSVTASPFPLVIYFPPTFTEEPEPKPEPTLGTTTPPIPTSTPTPTYMVMYLGGSTDGNIGPRFNADTFCSAGVPSGFSLYKAFISYDSTDSIATMPSIYGVPINAPIRSVTNFVIANDWADLMDGNIIDTLTNAGVVSLGVNWWTGVENSTGTHVDGTTDNCNNWTSNSNVVGGKAGSLVNSNSLWVDSNVVACDIPIAILCLAY